VAQHSAAGVVCWLNELTASKLPHGLCDRELLRCCDWILRDPHSERLPGLRLGLRRRERLRKRHSFRVSFHHVCPEPVLANDDGLS
jgi:hypothetical protein